MSSEHITKTEVSRRLRLSRPTVQRRLESGQIPGLVDHYGLSRVSRQVFEKWADSKDLVKKVKK